MLPRVSRTVKSRPEAVLDFSFAKRSVATVADLIGRRVDAFATLDQMVTEPARFGFTNVTDPLMYVGGNAAEFLFWDYVHPTTVGHAVFAEVAANSLINYFSPRQGEGTPPAAINALNGLVNAWNHN